MDNFYRDNILDHYKNHRNFGRLKNADASNEEENVTCGDKIGIDIKFENTQRGPDSDLIIKNVMFHGEGCAISTASASLLTDAVKGKKISKIMAMNKKDILKLLGIELSLSRFKCALLPLEALHKTISIFQNKK